MAQYGLVNKRSSPPTRRTLCPLHAVPMGEDNSFGDFTDERWCVDTEEDQTPLTSEMVEAMAVATAHHHQEHHHKVLSARARVLEAAAGEQQADITRALLWAGTTTVVRLPLQELQALRARTTALTVVL